MRSRQEVREDVVRRAEEAFPEDEWTLRTLEWDDGDFQIEAFHGIGETEGDSVIMEVIRGTPFTLDYQIREVVESKRYNVLREVLQDDSR